MINKYSSYMAESNAVNNTKKKETEKTAEAEKVSEAAESSKSKSTTDYVNELKKLVPSVELKIGNTFSSSKDGKTLTISPELLEQMQNDPEKEKEMKELIKGVESMTKFFDGMYKASGWTVVYRHSFIDENGKYRSMSLVRNDFMLDMSKELREERWENSEKLVEQTKEKIEKQLEELEELLEEKKEEQIKEETEKEQKELEKLLEEKEKVKEEKEQENEGLKQTQKEEKKENEETEEIGKEEERLKEEAKKEQEELEKIWEERKREEETSARNKVKQLLEKQFAASKDGILYLYDTDFKELLEAIREDAADKEDRKRQIQTGANLDLWV